MRCTCGKAFNPSCESHRFCSKQCREKEWRLNNPSQKGSERSVQCRGCSTDFVTTDSRKRFCSVDCRWRFFNGRRAVMKYESRTCPMCNTSFVPLQNAGVGRTYCSRKCRSKAHYKTWVSKNMKHGEKHRRTRCGLGEEAYSEMLAAQDGLCAICGCIETVLDRTGKPKKLSVDHCHTSITIRGLLCSSCNHGLGSFVDSPERLRAAAEYLERSR